MNDINFEKETINGQPSYFIRYYNKIFRDGWIVGEEIKLMMNYLVDDLLTDKWVYDTFDAEIRIAFSKLCKQSKHPFAGKPIELMLWQKSKREIIYSFKNATTGKRRFINIFELIARKNGKSTDKAVDASTDIFLESGLGICCSSNDDNQANLVFNEIKNMVKQMDPQGKRIHTNIVEIRNTKQFNNVFKITERTENKEGRVVHRAYIDEIHEMKDDRVVMPITQSTTTIDDPLIYEITTEGFEDGGYLDKRLEYALKVLRREISDDSLLPIIYRNDNEQEIWEDESSWWKANPSLGTTKKVDRLRSLVEKSKIEKDTRVWVLCKDFNIKQNTATAWLDIPDIEQNETDKFSLRDFYNKDSKTGFIWAFVGIDLAETTDLCAVTISIPIIENNQTEYYYHTMYFISDGKASEYGSQSKNPENKDWRKYQQDGLVIIVPGNEVTHDAIFNYLWSIFTEYRIRPFHIGYDQWHSKQLVEKLDQAFGSPDENDLCIRVLQRFDSMSNPMRSIAADFRSRAVHYNNNPITKWTLKNVALKTNNAGQIMPIKASLNSANRIDGAVSMIICRSVISQFTISFTQISKNAIIRLTSR